LEPRLDTSAPAPFRLQVPEEREERTMFTAVWELNGSTINALDGEIGKVDDILFDDEHWTVRHLIVHTGLWLLGRKVLISPIACGLPDRVLHALNVDLTRERIARVDLEPLRSSAVASGRPYSRKWERDYYDYFAWPYYWGGLNAWGPYRYPVGLAGMRFSAADREQQDDHDYADRAVSHLHSTKEVIGYRIFAADGRLGHVQDFIVDDETWRICCLAVDTEDWRSGKNVLLPPAWIGHVDWTGRSVTMNVTRNQVRNAPEWDPELPISRAFEEQLYRYYVLQSPWDHNRHREAAGRTLVL
jgi:sporulation protein YlmC with PRC-barrel domain